MTEEATTPIKRPRGRPRKIRVEPTPISAEQKLQSGMADKPVRRVSKPRPNLPEQISVGQAQPEPQPASQLKYIFAIGRRKRAVARVFLHRDGAGEIEVNGKPADQYFTTAAMREKVREPLNHSPLKTSARVVVKAAGGGLLSQSLAAQLGIARALLKIDPALRPAFRSRGFLTRDPREKERKKPGLKKARRAPQWQKR